MTAPVPNTNNVLLVHDLGRIPYEPAYARQLQEHARVLSWRDAPDPTPAGVLLLLEHDPPVVTISRRPDARKHLLASPDLLARHDIEVRETDRGGDITYHGPGQLVAYPILDLNRLHWSLHHYVRTLEEIAIRVAARFALHTRRDQGATGVWTDTPSPTDAAKLCAIGVRVKRWVTLHGLALNVSTNLDHFSLIVPCGLTGRPVTSLRNELGDAAPAMPDVKRALTEELTTVMADALTATR